MPGETRRDRRSYDPPVADPTPARRALSILANTLLAFALLGLAWGSIPGYFADPVRALATVCEMVPTWVILAGVTAGAGRGVRHLEEGRGRIVILNLVWFLGLLAVVFTRARGIATLPGGRALEWAGLAVTALGTVYRVGPMIELGRRFSLRVAIQPEHTLQTTGFYAHIRHPSYAGMLLMVLGLALVFRSAVGLGLTLATLGITVPRMNREESFLAEQFGEAYRDYMRRTRRLCARLRVNIAS